MFGILFLNFIFCITDFIYFYVLIYNGKCYTSHPYWVVIFILFLNNILDRLIPHVMLVLGMDVTHFPCTEM
jgi:hypothetical protein